MHASFRVLVLTLAAGTLAAQVPLGDPFPIHEYGDLFQVGPRIAVQPGGTFVVVWQSDGADGDGYGIRVRRFGPSGVPLTPELAVNQTTAGNQVNPDVASDGEGNIVVVWVGPEAGDNRIFTRHFAAGLTPASAEILLSQTTTSSLSVPDVDCRADGRFAVVWRSGSQSVDVMVAVFDPPAVPVVPEQVVNTEVPGHGFPHGSAAGLRSDGSFVVVWDGEGVEPGDSEIYQRRFSPEGDPLTGELQVSETDPYGYFYPDRVPEIAVDEQDGYQIVWRQMENLLFDRVHTVKVTPQGTVGPIQPLEDTLSAGGTFAATPDGEFVVTTADYYQRLGHRYDANGTLLRTFDLPIAVWATAALGDDIADLVLVGPVIVGQQYDLQGQRLGTILFADGFESGDTSEWDTTLP